MRRDSLNLAARLVVEYYLRVSPRDRFIVITDRPCSPFAARIAKRAKRITNDVHFFEMEQYSNGTRTNFPEEFRRIYEDSPTKAVSVYMHHQKNNRFSSRYELLNMEDPISLVASKYGIKHLSLPGLTDSVIKHGICSPDYGLMRFNDHLESELKDVREVRITTEAGTDLTLTLSPKDRSWVKEDRRVITYGEWQNLPIGEVYTVPIDANGVLVLRGIIGGYEKYCFCKKTPITFKIEGGQICNISCEGSERLLNGVKAELFKTQTSGTIAELGFGTNFGIKKLTYNLLLAEKYPGVHIAFGDPAMFIGKEHEAPNHTDMVLLKPTVYADGKMIMKDGKYLV